MFMCHLFSECLSVLVVAILVKCASTPWSTLQQLDSVNLANMSWTDPDCVLQHKT